MNVEHYVSQIHELKAKALSYPVPLANLRRALLDIREEVATAERSATDYANEVKADVADEAAMEGFQQKKKFTNDAQRAAEVQRRLGKDEEYARRARSLQEAKSRLKTTEIDLALKEDEQRATRAVIDLLCGEIDLIVAGQ